MDFSKNRHFFRLVQIIIVVAAASFTCQKTSAGKAGAGGAPKTWIYSRSAKQSSSSAMGVTGVPAFVNFPDRSQRLGVFITSAQSGGIWKSMGLSTGRVILTVDNRVVDSPSTIDRIIAGRSGTFEISFVKIVDGVPNIVKSSAFFSGTGSVSDTGSSSSSSGQIQDNTPLSTLESYMASLVNKDRAANGKPPVSENSRLSDLARSYAEYLLSHGQFSHTADGRDPLGRATAAGIKTGIAENLAFEPRGMLSEKELVSNAEKMFMNEPPNQKNHRGNILWDDAKSVGVGMARNKGTLMMVQEFSDSTP